MQIQKQPPRLSRYANIGRKKSPVRKVHRPPTGKFGKLVAWWQGLSRKQKVAVVGGPILAIMIIIPVVTYIMLANDIRDVERLMNRNNTGIVLKDRNGKTFYSIGRAEKRNIVKLDQISDHMKNALLASEDKDFYKHGGFNLFSIARAAVTRHGGGSTITQQLVKNTLLSDEHSLMRKYQEFFMSIAVEQNYSKDEILDMYLNSVYFGENAFGIEDAAKTYFNKTPKELTLAESAMLVGVLPAPSSYSPISGSAEYAKERQKTVLSRMVKEGYLTEAQKIEALAQQLAYAPPSTQNDSVAPHFAEMVVAELSDKYSSKKGGYEKDGYEKVMRSGYQVTTTLDIDMQNTLKDNINKQMRHINRMGGSNASGVVVDPTTGEVRALVGSADYNNEKWGKVNMVTTRRQPGSSFKPIYYAAALADGVITPATILQDKVKDFGGGYVPRDADKNEASRGGSATVRQALNWSLNIPSVEVMQKYGISRSVTVANSMGISSIKKGDHGLSLALGSAEASLQDMVHAYTAFANSGKQYDITKITQIDDKYAKTIYKHEGKSKQVISAQGAYLISDILSDRTTRARIFGSSITVNGNHTVAVKTGTTNDNRDAWTIGYNPQYVVGVWVGNNDNSAMISGGSDMAGPIWKSTMTSLLSGKPDVKFTLPSGIVQRAVCKDKGGLAAKAGANTYNEYFMSGALPTESCNSEPTKVSVCNLSTGKIETIDEDKFNSTKYSKDTANCKAPTITVCNLSTGKVETIDEASFNSTKYSKDTANCKSTNAKVAACDLKKGSVVMVDKSKIDGVNYSKDTSNCAAAGGNDNSGGSSGDSGGSNNGGNNSNNPGGNATSP